ncbi:MAG: hypothetical protein ACK5MT_14100 [Actinomycetales bacterium]
MTTATDVQVSGGAYGVGARLEALDELAAVLSGCGSELAADLLRLRGILADPALVAAGALDPVGSARVYGRVPGIVAELLAAAAGCQTLAGSVDKAAWGYRLAERDVLDWVSALWHHLGPVVAAPLLLGVAATAVGWAAGRMSLNSAEHLGHLLTGQGAGPLYGRVQREIREALDDTVDDLSGDADAGLTYLVSHPDLAREALATLPMVVPFLPADPQQARHSSGAAGFATLLTTAGRPFGLFVNGSVTLTPTPTRTIAAADSTQQMMLRLSGLTHPRGSLEGGQHVKGGVIVERVPQQDGTNRWVVYLPPTNDWGVDGGPYPSDLTSNVEMVAKQGMRPGGSQPDAVEAGLSAMRQAGIGADEPVMLVGFSQGGITAATLASDPQIRRRYQVAGVLTAGAPISEFEFPDDVQVLTLENSTDPIPELDGLNNPDRPSWVSVERDVLAADSASPVAARMADGETFAGHYLDGYVELAGMVDASDDPSVQAWRTSMADFMPADATVESTLYLARRDPPGEHP